MLASLTQNEKAEEKKWGKWHAKFNIAKLERVLKNIKYFNIMILSPKRSKGSWLKGISITLLVLLKSISVNRPSPPLNTDHYKTYAFRFH
jgi:hypothetical protein